MPTLEVLPGDITKFASPTLGTQDLRNMPYPSLIRERASFSVCWGILFLLHARPPSLMQMLPGQ